MTLDDSVRLMIREEVERIIGERLALSKASIIPPPAVYREKAGYKQVDAAAKAAGISRRALIGYESGSLQAERAETRQNWAKLAVVYQVDADELAKAFRAQRKLYQRRAS